MQPVESLMGFEDTPFKATSWPAKYYLLSETQILKKSVAVKFF